MSRSVSAYQPHHRRGGKLIGLAIVFLLILAGAVGGYLWYRGQGSSKSTASSGADADTADQENAVKPILVPGDFESIDKAIEAARDNDTIQLGEGEYDLSANLVAGVKISKPLTIRGAGIGKTTLVGKNKSRIGIQINKTDGLVAIEDLTVSKFAQNGIDIENPATQITRVQVTGSGNIGVALRSLPNTTLITSSLITDNHLTGVLSEKSAAVFTNDTIANNGALGINIQVADKASADAPTLLNCIVSGHTRAGVLFHFPATPEQANITYTDFFGNKDVALREQDASAVTIKKATVKPGTGNLTADPKFLDAVSYLLNDASPLKDKSSTGSDLGAYGTPPGAETVPSPAQ